jgi:hypothetical protein
LLESRVKPAAVLAAPLSSFSQVCSFVLATWHAWPQLFSANVFNGHFGRSLVFVPANTNLFLRILLIRILSCFIPIVVDQFSDALTYVLLHLYFTCERTRVEYIECGVCFSQSVYSHRTLLPFDQIHKEKEGGERGKQREGKSE